MKSSRQDRGIIWLVGTILFCCGLAFIDYPGARFFAGLGSAMLVMFLALAIEDGH